MIFKQMGLKKMGKLTGFQPPKVSPTSAKAQRFHRTFHGARNPTGRCGPA